jgi:hypothetical protein
MALNLAKLDAIQQHTAPEPFVFSMASMKRRALNQHLLRTFITNLDLDPSLIKSHPFESTGPSLPKTVQSIRPVGK